MRGQAFGFVAFLCATWVAARIGFILIADRDRQVAPDHKASAGAIAQPVTYIKQRRPLSHVATNTRSAANRTKGRAFAPFPAPLESMAVSSPRKIYARRDNAGDWIPDGNAPSDASSEAITSSLADPPKKGRSRSPTHKAHPNSGGGEFDDCEIVFGMLFVSGSDSTVVFDFAKEPLDCVA